MLSICRLYSEKVEQRSYWSHNINFSSNSILRFVFRFFPYIFRCDLQDITFDIYGVSLGKDKCGTMYNFVGVTPPPTHFSMRTNFTICLGPLFNITNTNPLIEFIETHRILGVEKFAIYDHSISAKVLEHLKFYTRNGIVEVLPWKILYDGRGIYYQGQMGMLDECLYRYMFRTKYIAFIDLDERIIPKQDYSWTELIYRLEQNISKKLKSDTCGFSFRNVFFNTKWPDDDESPVNENSSVRIQTLMKTRRQVLIQADTVRSKGIVNPLKVDLMTFHYVQISYNSKSQMYVVDPSVAALHHYRFRKILRESVIDRTMFKYSKDLIKRISQLHV